MKLSLLTFQKEKGGWLADATNELTTKISRSVQFDLHLLKSPKFDRESADIKKKKESEILQKKINPKARLIIWDEKGKSFKSSTEFSKALISHLEIGEVQMIIGGAFGIDDSIKQKAYATWSFSGLTMNHQVAMVAILEQIYRGLAIHKNLPYHNE